MASHNPTYNEMPQNDEYNNSHSYNKVETDTSSDMYAEFNYTVDNIDCDADDLVEYVAEHDNENEIETNDFQCDTNFTSVEELNSLPNEVIRRNNDMEQSNSSMFELVDNVEQDGFLDEEKNNEVEYMLNTTENYKAEYIIAPGGEHSDETLDTKVVMCYDCHSIFEDLESAEAHECPNTYVADKNVENVANSKHETSSNRNVPVSCKICNTVFHSAKNLRSHMRIHNKRALKSIHDALPVGAQRQYNELNQFFCEICNKSFDQNLLVVHKNMHQGVQEFICGVCNRNFENLQSYELHMKFHADKKQFKPNIPPRKQISSDTTNETEISTDKKYPCQYCDRSFRRPYEKVKHERVHTGEKPYECEVCGRTFRVSYSLTLHLRTHTDIRPYVCATCNKRFKSQQVYSHHLRTHNSECLYNCDICSKSFRTSVQLYAHKNSHTKPFNCTVCNRPFASMYAVKLHNMRTHNNSIPATGDVEAMSSKDIKKFTNSRDNAQNCVVCGATYARLFALHHHMRDVHGLEFEQPAARNKGKIVTNTTPTQIENNFRAVEVNEAEAVLIAAAAQADSGIYMNCNIEEDEQEKQDVMAAPPTYDGNEAIAETILNHEAFSIENYQAEEIITDWLTK